MSRHLPPVALLVVTAIWGSTFFILKDVLDHVAATDFLAVRFTLAAVVMIPLTWHRLRRLTRRSWLCGLGLGAVYGVAQILQTVGLRTTDASVSGFITGMYVVITPLILLLFFRTPLKRPVILASGLAFMGLAVLSLQGTSLSGGALLTLCGSVLYAVHIVLLGFLAGDEDAVALTTTQMIGIAVVCAVSAVPGGITVPATMGVWATLVYMVLAASIGTMFLQTWAQARMSATRAAVIMTFEPVFATGFAIAVGGEILTARLVVGGTLILVAMLIGELVGARAESQDEEPNGDVSGGPWPPVVTPDSAHEPRGP